MPRAILSSLYTVMLFFCASVFAQNVDLGSWHAYGGMGEG